MITNEGAMFRNLVELSLAPASAHRTLCVEAQCFTD